MERPTNLQDAIVDIQSGKYKGQTGWVKQIINNNEVRVSLLTGPKTTVKVLTRRLGNFREMEW